MAPANVAPAKPESIDLGTLSERLAALLGPGASRWIDESRLLVVDGRLEIVVATAFVADLLQHRHHAALDALAAAVLGSPRAWRLMIDPAVSPPDSAANPSDPNTMASDGALATGRTGEGRTEQARRRVGGDATGDRPAETAWGSGRGRSTAPRPVRRLIGATLERNLDEYVVGSSNRTAYAAAARMAAGDDPCPNRALFLHGECGVGKTHLILGLCAERQRNFPHERIRYTTGEQFTNEFLHHLRHGTLDEFRTRMRRVELLAIDDVHFLAGKTRTSGELLHTLDAIGLEGKRVVIASDGHPEQIRTFSRALRSRLSAGFVVRIDLPDRELRIALVRRLAERRSLPMTDTAIHTLITRCPGSARELEGSLSMLAALREFESNDGPVGQLLVERMFEHGDVVSSGPVRAATILAAVCDRLGIAKADPLGTGRNPRVVLARGVFTRLCREMTSMSFPEIAQALHRRTHSTVHAADRRMERLIAANSPVSELNDEDPITLLDLLDQIRRTIRRSG